MTNEKLNELLLPLVSDLGLEFVGLEFSPGHGGSRLRVFIDAPGQAVTIDDCERVSREISALLDVNDEMRVMQDEIIGCEVKLNTSLPIDGRQRFQGEIRGVDGDRVQLIQDGREVAINHTNVVKARLVPDYVALGIAPAPRKKQESGSRKRAPKHK